jgi:hypothetical protein
MSPLLHLASLRGPIQLSLPFSLHQQVTQVLTTNGGCSGAQPGMAEFSAHNLLYGKTSALIFTETTDGG